MRADRSPSSAQVFPLSPGPRWQVSSARPAALALQQALGQELARVRRGAPEVPGVAVRLLQAVAPLLSSPRGGALVASMQRSHFLACPLLRLLCQYQVGASSPGPGVPVLSPVSLRVGCSLLPAPRAGERRTAGASPAVVSRRRARPRSTRGVPLRAAL